LVVYKRFSARGEAFRSISALSLFAVIGNLLMSGEIGDLAAHSITSTVPAFGSVTASDDYDLSAEETADDPNSDEAESDEDVSTTQQNDAFDQFNTNLQNWHAFAREHIGTVTVSPSML